MFTNAFEYAQVEEFISLYPVAMISSSSCSLCDQAKRTFKKIGCVVPPSIEIDELAPPLAEKILESMQNLSGEHTVPQIFVNRKSIGGLQEAAALAQSGQLKELVNGALATLFYLCD